MLVCIYEYVRIFTYNVFIRFHARVQIQVYAHIVHTSRQMMYGHTNTHTYEYIHVCKSVRHQYFFTATCLQQVLHYIHIYNCSDTYTCTHTYTHTYVHTKEYFFVYWSPIANESLRVTMYDVKSAACLG